MKTKKCKHEYRLVEKSVIKSYMTNSDNGLIIDVTNGGYAYEFYCIYCLDIKTVKTKI